MGAAEELQQRRERKPAEEYKKLCIGRRGRDLYQIAETLTHLCHRPRPSTAPISHWTTVRFCNECPGGALAA
jgi:hypothetical protein